MKPRNPIARVVRRIHTSVVPDKLRMLVEEAVDRDELVEVDKQPREGLLVLPEGEAP